MHMTWRCDGLSIAFSSYDASKIFKGHMQTSCVYECRGTPLHSTPWDTIQS